MISSLSTPISDKITINQLQIETLIGTYSFERQLKQKLYVTIHYSLDAHKIAQQDDRNLDGIVDYAALSQSVIQFGIDNSFFLLETFAVKLMDHLFAHYPLTWIQLEITKAAALKNAQGVTITLCRTSLNPA